MINDSVAVPLEHSTEQKDLGVWTDDKLKIAGHVGHIVAKEGQLLGLIKRSFVHRDVWMLLKHYTRHLYDHIWSMQMLCGIYTVSQKNMSPNFCLYFDQILTDFKNSFAGTLCDKCAVTQLFNIPPHLYCVATLPCEI